MDWLCARLDYASYVSLVVLHRRKPISVAAHERFKKVMGAFNGVLLLD